MKTDVPHLVVVVPGIGGSVLRRGDDDLWKFSPSVALRALLSRGRSLDELVPDDPSRLDDPDFDDGIRATGLIEAPVSLPGVARLGGYEGLRRSLHDTYDLDELNYLEFAYDWRRDIRIAAAELARAVEQRLTELDAYVGRADVIVIAHSMGGLVARSWLSDHGGAERCRGLITLGTPYRGSPKAVRMLAGGYLWRSVGSERFAGLLRAFPSVHQLLPMYPCVHDTRTGQLHRVSEIADQLPGVDPARATRARELLTALNTSEHPALTSVVGGTGQSTLQSITLGADGLSFPNTELPGDFGRSAETDGDATVPWIAARPLDYGALRGLTPTFAIQTHGGLSREGGVLDAMKARLAHLLVDDDPARAPFEIDTPPTRDGADEPPRLGFDLAEDYVEHEPVDLRITTGGLPDGSSVMLAVDGTPAATMVVGEPPDLTLPPLPAGAHSVSASATAPVGPRELRVIDTIDVWPA